MPKAVDLRGQRFGRLVATRATSERQGSFVIWECDCDCGQVTKVTSSNLRRGNTQSCGCLQYETRLQNTENRLNLTGKRFGKLTVIKETELRLGGQIVWTCECDCGRETEVSSANLVTGNTKSCGCLNKERIKELGKVGREKAYIHNEKHNWKEGTYLGLLTAKKPKDNKSGVKGVHWDSSRQKWKATIGFKSKDIYLGRFNSLEEAARARKKAEEKYFHPVLEKYKN